jgi:aminopeptidase
MGAPPAALRGEATAWHRGGEMIERQTVDRLARLVELGANVQSDQIVLVQASVERAAGARAVAAAAYQRGARFVDVSYSDPHVKRARLVHAAEGTLDFVPRWYGDRWLAASELRCAFIALVGAVETRLYADLDPARVVRDRLPMLKEMPAVFNARTMNMCIAPWPDAEWARIVFPGLEAEQAAEKLTCQIAHMLRLDDPDPVAAWEERLASLRNACARLNERRFDALNLAGPGTDLRVGLFAGSLWVTGDEVSPAGIRFVRALPTEEVFTTPDPERIDGVVTATRPFAIQGGQIMVEGLRPRFREAASSNSRPSVAPTRCGNGCQSTPARHASVK